MGAEPVDWFPGPAPSDGQGPRRRQGAHRHIAAACVFVIAPATWRLFVQPTKVTDGASRDTLLEPRHDDRGLSGESAVSKLVTDAPSVVHPNEARFPAADGGGRGG